MKMRSGNQRSGKSYMLPFIAQSEANRTGQNVLVIEARRVRTVTPRKDGLGCEHVEAIPAYKGALYLCLDCIKMFCAECVAGHEHQTVPPHKEIPK